jgi:hypothetical protein
VTQSVGMRQAKPKPGQGYIKKENHHGAHLSLEMEIQFEGFAAQCREILEGTVYLVS